MKINEENTDQFSKSYSNKPKYRDIFKIWLGFPNREKSRMIRKQFFPSS